MKIELNKKNHNSVLFLTTLGVYLGLLMVGAAAQTHAQAIQTVNAHSLPRPSSDTCSALRKTVRDLELNYLWFNQNSIHEYVWVLQSILEAYPEKRAEWFELSWASANSSRPFELVSPSLYLAPVKFDTETHGSISKDVLWLANGFPAGRSFEFTLQRNTIETVAKLKIEFTGVDHNSFRSAYSSVVDLGRCGTSLVAYEFIIYNTELDVQDDNLVIITRLPRGSLAAHYIEDAK